MKLASTLPLSPQFLLFLPPKLMVSFKINVTCVHT